MKFRTLFKADKWWVYKIAGGLFTVLLFTVHYKTPINFLYWQSLSLLFGAFISLAVFGHVLNDFCDFKADVLVGKKNIVAELGKKTSLLLITTALCVALALVSVLKSSTLLVLILVQVILNIAYSVRPIRLKERGFWAVIVTGFYERTLPYIMIVILLNDLVKIELTVFLVIYLLWSFIWETRNYISGQRNDRPSDILSDQKTVSVVVNNDVLNTVHWLLFGVEVVLFVGWVACWMYGLVALLIGIALTLYFYGRKHSTYRVKKPELFNIVDDLYNLSLPVLFSFVAVLTCNKSLWPILILLVVGFNNHIRILFLIWFRNVDWYKCWRWFTFPYRTASLIFNWSVYYFRKWVLKWPEERNWGKHYLKHLEDKQQRSELRKTCEEDA